MEKHWKGEARGIVQSCMLRNRLASEFLILSVAHFVDSAIKTGRIRKPEGYLLSLLKVAVADPNKWLAEQLQDFSPPPGLSLQF